MVFLMVGKVAWLLAQALKELSGRSTGGRQEFFQGSRAPQCNTPYILSQPNGEALRWVPGDLKRVPWPLWASVSICAQ